MSNAKRQTSNAKRQTSDLIDLAVGEVVPGIDQFCQDTDGDFGREDGVEFYPDGHIHPAELLCGQEILGQETLF